MAWWAILYHLNQILRVHFLNKKLHHFTFTGLLVSIAISTKSVRINKLSFQAHGHHNCDHLVISRSKNGSALFSTLSSKCLINQGDTYQRVNLSVHWIHLFMYMYKYIFCNKSWTLTCPFSEIRTLILFWIALFWYRNGISILNMLFQTTSSISSLRYFTAISLST